MDSPFVGRESEVQRIRAMLTAAAAGHGQMIIVRGEAGIGKTRLTEEFAALATTAGFRVSRGQALNDPGMPVLWPWRSALADIPGGPELLDGADPVELVTTADAVNARFRLLTRVADLVVQSASRQRRMLVLEDLHWADELSCALLRHLVIAVRAAPVIIAVTVRAPQSPALPERVDRTLAELVALPATRVMRLGGLSSRAVERWLSSLQGIPRPLAHRVATSVADADGANPLHVRLLGESLLQHPTQDPTIVDAPDLRRLVRQQLTALPERVQRTLRAASMINDRISTRLLAAITDESAEDVATDLEYAIGAGILRRAPGEDDCTYVHVLVRDAVRADLAAAERQQLHFRAATAIAATPHSERFAGLIARHWLLSRRPEADREALHWLRRAATVATARQDLDTALDAWGQALAAADRLGLPEVRGWLHIDRARARFCAGKINESLADSAAAVALARQVGDPEMAARAALVVAGIGGVEVSATIESLCNDALALMPQPPTLPVHRHLTSRMLSRRAQTLVARDLPRAEELSARALSMVDDGCADAVLDAVAARHLALSSSRHWVERTALAERAVGVGAAAHQPLGRAWGHIWMFEAAMQAGDLDRADSEIAALQGIVAADEWPMARWQLLRERACRAALVGDFEAAAGFAADAGALATDLADHSIQHLHPGFVAELGMLRGDLPEAVLADTLTRFGRAGGTGPVPGLMLVRLLLHSGDVSGAQEAYRPWRRMIMESPAGPARQALMIWQGEIGIALRDTELIDSSYRMLIGEPGPYCGDGSGMIISTGALSRHVADLAYASGRPGEAVDRYRTAIGENLRIGAAPFVALARLGLAAALLDDSLPDRGPASADEARRQLDEAAVAFRRLGMPGPLARAERLLRAIPARRTGGVLTPREAEIARLVAQAQSNREIAERLVLSERTVESHVRNALAKIGAETRTGLAAWVLRGSG